MAYKVNMRDIYFNLFEVLGVEKLLELDKFKDFTLEDFKMILTQAEKMATDVIFPTLEVTDKDGCRYENGKVIVPEAVREAFHKYNEGGWGAMMASQEYGGQGLPAAIMVGVGDMCVAANTGFGLYQGLTSATANLIEEEGSEELKKLFCEKMYTGTWAGCMVLTEPQAGSAVGDAKTTARRDGKYYNLTGNKIFISGGDHDMTDNIVHILLARVEGAPAGIKGLSLFVAPKYWVNPDGSLGAFNNIVATGIEEKMGLHSSATCAVAYGEEGPCRAWIIGEENQGIQIMFKLMNHARVGAGLQAVSQAAHAYQLALAYANERIQGVRIQDFKDPNAPRVPIIEHPDIRRMLMKQKAIVEATRTLVYHCAFWMDMARNSKEMTEEMQRCQDLVELLTPIVKGYSTEKGFDATCLALQVHGGYGYCEDYGVSVMVRDAKIGTIYEGTTGIQSLDLLGRKITMRQGALFMNFMSVLNEFIETNREHPALSRAIAQLDEAKNVLAQTTMYIGQKGMGGDMLYPVLYATPYLFMFGGVACGYFILKQALVAHQKLEELMAKKGAKDEAARKKVIADNADAKFYFGKVETAKFFLSNVTPEVYMVEKIIASEDTSALDMVF